jgi:general secretion pathway protein C
MMTIQRAITIINLILITLIAYLGVALFYRVIATDTPSVLDRAISESPPAPPADSSDKPADTYALIAERDLFRTRTATPVQPAAQTQSIDALDETQLKLKLWGTVSGDPAKAYAVIEDLQKRQQDLYRIGDDIQQATLKMILREKVVITVAGKDEVLSMAENTPSGGRTVARAEPDSPDNEAEEFPPAEDPMVDRAQKVSLNRGIIDSAMQDVSKLMTEITITPHMEDGQSSGLAISNIRPNSIFRRMGLRNGDILVGVDGQEIRSVDDAMRFYESLKSSSELKVQINRRGQERTIDYSIR